VNEHQPAKQPLSPGLPSPKKQSAEDAFRAYRARHPGHARFVGDPDEPTIDEWDDPTGEKPLV